METTEVKEGIYVIKKSQSGAPVVGSDGLGRVSAFSHQSGDIQTFGMGLVIAPPGTDTGLHQHGLSQIGGYVLQGKSRFTWGADGSASAELEPGDFFMIEPGTIHSEQTLGDQDFVFVVARLAP